MDDKRLQIEFEIAQLKDTVSKLDEASRATVRGTEANREHGKSVIEMAEHTRGFHRVLHSITEESPLAGLALHAAFSLPGAAIAGLILALHAMKKAEEESAKAAKEAGEAAAEAFSDVKGAVEKSVDSIHKAREAHAEWVRSLTEKTKVVEQQVDKQIAKLKELAELAKKLAEAEGRPTGQIAGGQRAGEIDVLSAGKAALERQLAAAFASEEMASLAADIGRKERVEILKANAAKEDKQAETDKKAVATALTARAEADTFRFGDIGKRILSSLRDIEPIDPRATRVAAADAAVATATTTSRLSEERAQKTRDRLASEEAAQAKLEEVAKRATKQVEDLNDQLKSLTTRLDTARMQDTMRSFGEGVAGPSGERDPLAVTFMRGVNALAVQSKIISGQAGPSPLYTRSMQDFSKMIRALHEEQQIPLLMKNLDNLEYLANLYKELKAQQDRLTAQIKGTHMQ